MKDTIYFKQAKLLLQVLPSIDKTNCFALKGGTAINFFHRDMPRLSVDIDLTYLPINTREEALADISKSLKHIGSLVTKELGARVDEINLSGTDKTVKLQVRYQGATIKVEPNVVIRGSLFPPYPADLRPKAVEMFELSVTTTVLSVPDLYGGKICAALDRQHPRDFYDVRFLLDNEGLTDDVRQAFLVFLASHDRPMHELLRPKLKDMRQVYENEFKGMTVEPVEFVSAGRKV